jgi:hypothetical protein
MSKPTNDMRHYIAPGLLDFSMTIPVGDGWVRVEFTGGRSAGYGEYSAGYSTDDPVMIRLIENSREFRSGRVRKR